MYRCGHRIVLQTATSIQGLEKMAICATKGIPIRPLKLTHLDLTYIDHHSIKTIMIRCLSRLLSMENDSVSSLNHPKLRPLPRKCPFLGALVIELLRRLLRARFTSTEWAWVRTLARCLDQTIWPPLHRLWLEWGHIARLGSGLRLLVETILQVQLRNVYRSLFLMGTDLISHIMAQNRLILMIIMWLTLETFEMEVIDQSYIMW